jgi:hypothetical protein
MLHNRNSQQEFMNCPRLSQTEGGGMEIGAALAPIRKRGLDL